MAFGPDRFAWVDYAKGICIVLVVMMHSTLGVEQATGESSWMGALLAFAKPFRVPDFFLISWRKSSTGPGAPIWIQGSSTSPISTHIG